jgi:hypothetical protein
MTGAKCSPSDTVQLQMKELQLTIRPRGSRVDPQRGTPHNQRGSAGRASGPSGCQFVRDIRKEVSTSHTPVEEVLGPQHPPQGPLSTTRDLGGGEGCSHSHQQGAKEGRTDRTLLLHSHFRRCFLRRTAGDGREGGQGAARTGARRVPQRTLSVQRRGSHHRWRQPHGAAQLQTQGLQ